MNFSPTIERSDLTLLKTLLEGRYHGRSLQTFRKGQTIPLYDNDIWLVYRGVIQITTLYPSGDEAILGLISPLMPFGIPLSLLQTYSASAITEVDLMRISWTEIQQSPELMECLLGQMVRRLQQSEALTAIASHRRVEDRLLEFLQLLKRDHSLPTPQGHRLTIRLTHQHFANAIGTTRVTVTRLLGQLRDRHLIDFDNTRHILIP
jgi:CRP-like cAMP-binding protein